MPLYLPINLYIIPSILPGFVAKIISYFCCLTIALFLGAVLFFLTPQTIFAQTYSFNDEFNQERAQGSLDTNLWTINENIRCGTHTFQETTGFLKFFQCTNSRQFPYIISKTNPFPSGDYSIEVAFQYTKQAWWGTGFAIAPQAPVNGAGPIDNLPNISVWQDQVKGNMRVTYKGVDVYTTAPNTDPHIFRVDRKNNKYLIYLDNNLIYTSQEDLINNTVFWMGNPTFQTPAVNWTEFKIDYVRVSQLPTLLPVIFIPGIGGSELKANQAITWDKDDGHGGTFSHNYSSGEKIWVNSGEAIKLGDDDYFDVLRLKPDGQTPEADVGITGELTSFGYPDIDNFFQGLGYIKGTNFFVYAYDWRKDIKTTEPDLDTLINQALQKSGQSKVNIVAHSMGGLVARYYITDDSKALKVNKLIELGVPHLGSVNGLKAMMYGQDIGKPILGIFNIGVPASEVLDIMKNLPSAFELLPNSHYYSFYDNSSEELLYPFLDQRDIDKNGEKGHLNFTQLTTLIKNTVTNLLPYNLAEEFNSIILPYLNQSTNVKLYSIVGVGKPTLGQIQETWLIKWPINLIPKVEELFINGDGTVPIYSASLRSTSLDLSNNSSIFYTEQKHSDLTESSGQAMQIVKQILAELDSALVAGQKTKLGGRQISVNEGELDLFDDNNNHTGLNANGEIETNIPGTFYDSLGNSKHVFLKNNSPKVKVIITSPKNTTTDLKVRNYQEDQITKTIIYKEVPINSSNNTQLIITPNPNLQPVLTINDEVTPITSEASGSAALDLTPPETTAKTEGILNTNGNYDGPVTITLFGNDAESGILQIEYSLDNGQTVQPYTNPFTISAPETTTIQFTSTDKLGNQEIPQTITVTINSPISLSTISSNSEPSNKSNNSANNNPNTQNNSSNIVDKIQSGITYGLSDFSEFISPSNNSDNILGVNKISENTYNQSSAKEEVLGLKTVNPVTQLDINNPNDKLRILMIPLIIEGILSMMLVITFMKKSQE